MVLNVFVHTAGLKLEVFSTPLHCVILVLRCGSIKENFLISWFRKSHQLWLVTKLENLVARFGRVPDSKESSNGLAPESRSNPRRPDSVPPPSLDNTHTKLFGQCFFSDYSPGHATDPFDRHQFYPSPPNSQVFSYPWNSRSPRDLYFSSLRQSSDPKVIHKMSHPSPGGVGLLIPIVSQDHTYWTPRHIRKTPNQGLGVTILASPPYIPFCMYHLPTRHMMCVHF